MKNEINIAIFDFGTSRAKLTYATKSGKEIIFKNYSFDTELGRIFQQKTHDFQIDEAKSRIADAINYLNDKIPSKSGVYRMTVLTEVFRDFPCLIKELKNKKEHLGNIELITGHDEGVIFFQALKSKNDNFVLLDIGGGSIQIAFENDIKELQVNSLPIGTYKIQQSHQKDCMDKLTLNDYNNMLSFTEEFLKENIKTDRNFEKIILGSNVMEDFFKSASKASKINLSIEKNIKNIENFLNTKLINKKYTDIYKYFPEKEGFMHGADKALIISLSLSKILKTSKIIPTNESISSSIAKLSFQYLESSNTDNKKYSFKSVINYIKQK